MLMVALPSAGACVLLQRHPGSNSLILPCPIIQIHGFISNSVSPLVSGGEQRALVLLCTIWRCLRDPTDQQLKKR